jgi:hypothetical protein
VSAEIAPLALTLDPAEVREASRVWRGRNRNGIALRPVQLVVGLVYIALGIIGLVAIKPATLASMPAITCAVFVVLGAVSALQGIGRLDFQPRPLPVATLHLDNAAITAVEESGTRRTFPWRTVKSVERTADAFVFVLTWRRAIVVPLTALAEHQCDLWPQLYAHLVSRRGLRATSAENVNEIVNTALT